VVNLVRSRSCKDPRDKVYLILGQLPRESRKFIAPDYTKPMTWTYAIFMSAYVHTQGDLWTLVRIQDGTTHTIFPSWAVDLNCSSKLQLLDDVVITLTNNIPTSGPYCGVCSQVALESSTTSHFGFGIFNDNLSSKSLIGSALGCYGATGNLCQTPSRPTAV
jgi:hypothetical protein